MKKKLVGGHGVSIPYNEPYNEIFDIRNDYQIPKLQKKDLKEREGLQKQLFKEK